jgi:hypothetical protein
VENPMAKRKVEDDGAALVQRRSTRHKTNKIPEETPPKSNGPAESDKVAQAGKKTPDSKGDELKSEEKVLYIFSVVHLHDS